MVTARILYTVRFCCKVYDAWDQCLGKKTKVNALLKGESDEYTLEVIKYHEDNKGVAWISAFFAALFQCTV